MPETIDVLPLVIDGVRRILANKGQPIDVLDGATLFSSLEFDSLEVAELLLHIEIVTRKPVYFSPSIPIRTIEDLASYLKTVLIEK